jgi:rubredoxin
MTIRAASGTRWGHAPSPLRGCWWYPHPLAGENLTIDGGNEMSDYKLFVCVQCGFEYDEAKGWPEDGIAPGTRWDDIPEDWSCPDCGAAKSDFEMVEVARS